MQRINNSEQNSQTIDKNISSIKTCQTAPLGTGGMSAKDSDTLRAGNKHSTGSRAHTLCTAAAQGGGKLTPRGDITAHFLLPFSAPLANMGGSC